MKTTYYLFLAFGAAALTLTACNNDDDVLNGGQEPGVVNIVTSINGSGSFENTKDKLKLAVYGSGNADYQVDYTVGTTVLYWEDVEAGAGTGPYTFGGWFTKTDLPATLTSFNAATASDPDLLLAAPATNVSKGETVNLNFKHAMHKLVVKVTYEGDFTGVNTDDVSIKPVGMNASAAINVQTGIVTPGEATDTDGDYAAQTLTNNSCSFILAPQKLTTGAEWLQFSIPDVATLVYKVPANYLNASGSSTALTELSSGQILTLNMKIKRDSATQKTEVELTTGHISAWGTQGSINDELTIPAN